MEKDILDELKGGDRRSIGKSETVVRQVRKNPSLFASLISGMRADDPLVRMRAADAAEKITAKQPELLKPYRDFILNEIAPITQQEVRWHVAQMIPRLELSGSGRKQAFQILSGYLSDKSRIVRTFAMQALADLSRNDQRLKKNVLPLIEKLTRAGTPAMKARGKKLLTQLKRGSEDERPAASRRPRQRP